jgi:four helix bundle protein
MPADEQHNITWEHRQAELWERLFQVTSDVVALADSLSEDTGGKVVKESMVRAAMAVGAQLVRATAADEAGEFRASIKEARMQAVETDYWLRMAYVLQQREDVQRDLSGIINQYTGIVDLLDRFIRHTKAEKDVLARHARGPRVS